MTRLTDLGTASRFMRPLRSSRKVPEHPSTCRSTCGTMFPSIAVGSDTLDMFQNDMGNFLGIYRNLITPM